MPICYRPTNLCLHVYLIRRVCSFRAISRARLCRAVKRVSDMFMFVLLTQMVGSMGGEVFALYIIQTEFYVAMVFSAVAIMGQVFLYCFLGDMLVQVVTISRTIFTRLLIYVLAHARTRARPYRAPIISWP